MIWLLDLGGKELVVLVANTRRDFFATVTRLPQAVLSTR